ncbi:MAG TPA: ATP-binding protein [Patescibacteria group bacterium]|nr:ATP-binding protein [Patescibacteria group bacterium]
MSEKNKQFTRYLAKDIQRMIKKNNSILLFGPRQVGKTTLVSNALSSISNKAEYYLQNPMIRRELEVNPSKIIDQVSAYEKAPYVFIDEAQKVPEIFDAAQFLIDDRKARFIFTGSSARKLRRAGTNLLPGRVVRYFLDPLSWGELGLIKQSNVRGLEVDNINPPASFTFKDSLVFGSLPAIASLKQPERGLFLKSYADIYLEEEIRAEAISRKIGAFGKFLELAAAESGTAPNLTKLSQEALVSQPAIKEFYRILEDTLIVERVEPYVKSARKRILSSPRYYFFDLGVRNALARLPLSPDLINAQKGVLFEHAVMLEIIRRTRLLHKDYRVHFWRTQHGLEVDCVIDMGDEIVPIEIKASRSVSLSDIRGLRTFLEDYKKNAKRGYVITMGERKEKLAENIIALPWNEI